MHNAHAHSWPRYESINSSVTDLVADCWMADNTEQPTHFCCKTHNPSPGNIQGPAEGPSLWTSWCDSTPDGNLKWKGIQI